MKILHVSSSDINGGAARACYRLHIALLQHGEDSQILVQTKVSDDHTVIGPDTNFQKISAKIRPHIEQLPKRRYPNRSRTPFSVAWVPFSGMADRINALQPDIVHLHWINGGMLRIEELAKIKAPIVWALHDMWPFTGGCHYNEGCERYKNKCGKCRVLRSQHENDLSRSIWNRKRKALDKIKNLTIVGVSNWISDCATESKLFRGREVVTIPNTLDTSVYKPTNKKIAKNIWGLPQDKRLILFGALSATTDDRKGHGLLLAALRELDMDDIELVVFGSSAPKEGNPLPYKTHYMGRLHDDVSLALLYSAADVMVVPSKQEAFGQTASESMACGTPVVAFNHTGLKDIVDHQINGYLATPFDSEDLRNGIKWVLAFDSRTMELIKAARLKAVHHYSIYTVVKPYEELYKKVLP